MKFVALITVSIFLFAVIMLVGSILIPTLVFLFALIMTVCEDILHWTGNFWFNL